MAIVSALAGASVAAQETPNSPQIEQLSPFFEIDDFVTNDEGTRAERQKLALLVIDEVLKHGNERENGILEWIRPLNLPSGQVSVGVMWKEDERELRIRIFRGNAYPIVLVDPGVTGTPLQHQLPVTERGLPRTPGNISEGELPLANRVYFGILNHLLGKS